MNQHHPRTVEAVLADVESAVSGNGHVRVPFATGLDPLDEALGGGLRSGDLTLVGGKPGVGKTVATLQWARNLARDGHTSIFASYQHDAEALLARLVMLELGELAEAQGTAVGALAGGVRQFAAGWRSLDEVEDPRGLLAEVRGRLSPYEARLWLVPASSAHTSVAELAKIVDQRRDEQTALFVDYLPRVGLRGHRGPVAEKALIVTEALKELALSERIAVVAVVASGIAGLTAGRQRLHHLRDASAAAYEADVAIMLNDKVDAVSKVHLAYDTVLAETFHEQVVFSVEKNRAGPAGIDCEFRKDFQHWRFDPKGSWVTHRLVDDRLVAE